MRLLGDSVDSMLTKQQPVCRVYDLLEYKRERPDLFLTRTLPELPGQVIHFCPSYAAGFAFYRAELSILSAHVLTQIVTLLSSDAFDQDQRWELLQFVTQVNFAKLSSDDQWCVLSMIERSPGLSIHLLLAMLNNRLKKRASAFARTSDPVQAARAGAASLDLTDGASLKVSGIDQKRYTPALYEDITMTLHTLLDVTRDAALASAYVDLVACPGFLGSSGQLGLHLNQMIRRDMSVITPAVLRQLAKVIGTVPFATLLFPRQRLLLGSMRNLTVLEWPNVVAHLSALASALQGASRAELDALGRYFCIGHA